MEILTNCELTEHVGLIHDDEMKKEKNYAMFVEVNSTKSCGKRCCNLVERNYIFQMK